MLWKNIHKRKREQKKRERERNWIDSLVEAGSVTKQSNSMDLAELWAIFGPGVAGAVFGAGWWFWIDAVVCSSVKVSFIHYLPGPPSLASSTYIWVIRVLIFCLIVCLCVGRYFCVSCGFDVQLRAERRHRLFSLRRRRVEVSRAFSIHSCVCFFPIRS